jgi:hypothetical protein
VSLSYLVTHGEILKHHDDDQYLYTTFDQVPPDNGKLPKKFLSEEQFTQCIYMSQEVTKSSYVRRYNKCFINSDFSKIIVCSVEALS